LVCLGSQLAFVFLILFFKVNKELKGIFPVSKVFLITSRFPYGYSEQFLEHELPYWEGKDLTIFPLMKDAESPRCEKCTVDDRLNVTGKTVFWKLTDVFSTFVDYQFWLELGYLLGHGNLRALRPLIIYTILSNRLCRSILKNEALFDDVSVVYCYWSNWSLRGLALAKRKNPSLNFKLIARSHRVDLYKYAIPGNHMPYRHRFHPYVDCYYSISDDGKGYLESHYGLPSDKVRVHRLGVPDKGGALDRTKFKGDEVRLISVSYAKKVKRIDRIIDALSILNSRHPDLSLSWTHIGGGDELENLKDYAVGRGVHCNWLGMQPNEFVLKFLADGKRSIFINVSDSEGVPVSIMEAMSFGIPVIATDVGGSGEIVNEKIGRLIASPFNADDVASGIFEIIGCPPSYEQVRRHYKEICSVDNYRNFVSEIAYY